MSFFFDFPSNSQLGGNVATFVRDKRDLNYESTNACGIFWKIVLDDFLNIFFRNFFEKMFGKFYWKMFGKFFFERFSEIFFGDIFGKILLEMFVEMSRVGYFK